MTQEIIEMAQESGLIGMRPHLDGIYIESLLAFAKRVEEKALAEHAMRETQRLGQEIEQEPVMWSDYESNGMHHKPVAWMDADGNVSDNNDHKCFPIPLYTHPPQRTWVGLTKQQQLDIFAQSVAKKRSEHEHYMAIEQALKERNQ